MKLGGSESGTDGVASVGKNFVVGLAGAGMTAAMVLGGAGSARAAVPVTCGAVLETDGYLSADLYCPNGNGIYLDLDVTLDLRGHRLIGPGATATVGNGIGVTIAPVRPSRIVNGTITGWPIAIGGNEDKETFPSAVLRDLRLVGNGTAVLANQADLDLKRMTVRDNAVGIDASGGFEAVAVTVAMADSTFRGNGRAVSCVDIGCDVRGSAFVRNGTGMAVAGVGSVGLRDSSFTRNGVGFTRTAVGSSEPPDLPP